MAVATVVDELLEQRSKSLFGNRHMLRVAQDIAGRSEAFTVTDVAARTEVPYSTAHRLVRQLEAVGLLTVQPVVPTEPQHRWYLRATHTFWNAARDLCEAAAAPKTPRASKRSAIGGTSQRRPAGRSGARSTAGEG